MAVRLKAGKFDVVADTPEEAAKIMTLLDPSLVRGIREPEFPRGLSVEWSAQLVEAFRELLKEQPLQRRLLNSLYAGGRAGVLKEDLVKELKLNNAKQLAGPFSGLAKNAKKIGLAREAVYSMEKIQVEGKRTYRYWPNESLRSVAIAIRDKAADSQELPELRSFIRSRRTALAGFMEQGAGLAINGDVLTVTARNDIYIRYLNDNKAVLAELASEFLHRKMTVVLATGNTPRPDRSSDSA